MRNETRQDYSKFSSDDIRIYKGRVSKIGQVPTYTMRGKSVAGDGYDLNHFKSTYLFGVNVAALQKSPAHHGPPTHSG